jgi:hypothetical protein
MIQKLVVLIDNELVGHLWLDDKKRFCFQYGEPLGSGF